MRVATEMNSVTLFILFHVLCIVELKIIYNTYPPAGLQRATQFVPKVVSKTCMLNPDEGPCRGKIRMFYFSPEAMDCQEFHWGGCQGNGNRFDSAEECKWSCMSRNNTKSARPRYCNLSFDYGFCFGVAKRYYFDRLWKVCKETIYSGCGGNKNNFYNMEECDSVCRFGKGRIETEKTQGKKTKVLIINPGSATAARQ